MRTASIVSAEPLSILKTESRNSLAARRALTSIQNAAANINSDRLDGNSDSSGGEHDTIISNK